MRSSSPPLFHRQHDHGLATASTGQTSEMMTPPRDLDGLVRLRADLIREGLTDNGIARLVRDNVLVRIRYGAYVPHGAWTACSAEDRHRLRCRAVLRSAHESTVLSHTSSLVERGVPLWGLPLDRVHTTRTTERRAGRRTDGWTPHRAALGEDDVEELNGVPVTRAARSAVEVTTIASVEVALVVVNRLLFARAMTLETFAAEVERCRTWPRTLTANLVIPLADARLESVGEDRFSYLAYRFGLPKPEPQVKVFDEYGNLIGRVDFAWPELGVFLEFDGKVKYAQHRREGETLDEFLMREKRREELVCQVTGWTCIRVTWDQLSQPEVLAARIRTILGSRGRRAS